MDNRPGLAILANGLTPYRAHLHRRIAREMPEYRLYSLFTHEPSAETPWRIAPPAEINAISFGTGDGVDQQGRPSRALAEWRKGGRVIRWLRKLRPAAVMIVTYNDVGRLRVARWCRRTGIRTLLWADSNSVGDTARGLRKWAKRRYLGYFLRRIDAVLVCGVRGTEYFQSYGVPLDRIFRCPVAPDFDQIAGITDDQRVRFADRFGLAPGRRRFIFSGRLAPEKRVDLLIDAFISIAGQVPDWDLLIVGGGPLERSLRARVPEALTSRVRWTGFLDRQEDVSTAYYQGDVLVLPSDYEPWGVVVPEAMAAGLAVIVSDKVGAAADLVMTALMAGYSHSDKPMI